VRSQDADTFALESIPDVAVVIIVASKQQTARKRECNRSDTAENVVVGILVQFTVSPEIKETAGGVV
jgi:hypothetical protein